MAPTPVRFVPESPGIAPQTVTQESQRRPISRYAGRGRSSRSLRGLETRGTASCCIRSKSSRFEGHAALKDIFPPWLLAASLVLVLLKLIATFPEWSDPRSERYAPWFKFFADLAALAAAAYAALMAVFFASIPKIFGLLDTFVHQVIFVIIVVVVIAVLSVVFLKRRKIFKTELQAGGAGEVPHF